MGLLPEVWACNCWPSLPPSPSPTSVPPCGTYLAKLRHQIPTVVHRLGGVIVQHWQSRDFSGSSRLLSVSLQAAAPTLAANTGRCERSAAASVSCSWRYHDGRLSHERCVGMSPATKTFVSRTSRRRSPPAHRSWPPLPPDRTDLGHCLRERCVLVEATRRGDTLEQLPQLVSHRNAVAVSKI